MLSITIVYSTDINTNGYSNICKIKSTLRIFYRIVQRCQKNQIQTLVYYLLKEQVLLQKISFTKKHKNYTCEKNNWLG